MNGVRISLFGGGYVYYLLSRESGLLVRLLVAFGGIIVNMLSGLLLFIFIRKPGKRSGGAFFPILFGMVSLLGAIAYCALGFYYDHGDPVAWADRASPQGGWFSIPFLVVSPFVSYFAVKAYSIIYEYNLLSLFYKDRLDAQSIFYISSFYIRICGLFWIPNPPLSPQGGNHRNPDTSELCLKPIYCQIFRMLL